MLATACADAFSPQPLPAGVVLFDSDRSGHYELYRMSADGRHQVRLTNDRRYDSWWPKLSPDRKTIVFVRTPAGTHDTNYSKVSTWAVDADGRHVRSLILYLLAHRS